MAIRPVSSVNFLANRSNAAFEGRRKNQTEPDFEYTPIRQKLAVPLAATILAMSPMSSTAANHDNFDELNGINEIEYVSTPELSGTNQRLEDRLKLSDTDERLEDRLKLSDTDERLEDRLNLSGTDERLEDRLNLSGTPEVSGTNQSGEVLRYVESRPRMPRRPELGTIYLRAYSNDGNDDNVERFQYREEYKLPGSAVPRVRDIKNVKWLIVSKDPIDSPIGRGSTDSPIVFGYGTYENLKTGSKSEGYMSFKIINDDVAKGLIDFAKSSPSNNGALKILEVDNLDYGSIESGLYNDDDKIGAKLRELLGIK